MGMAKAENVETVDARGSKTSAPGLVFIPMEGGARTVGVAVATVIEGEGPRC